MAQSQLLSPGDRAAPSVSVSTSLPDVSQPRNAHSGRGYGSGVFGPQPLSFLPKGRWRGTAGREEAKAGGRGSWGLWQRHFPRPPGPRTEAVLFQRRACGSEPRSWNFLQDDLRAEGRGLQTTGSTNSFLNLCDFLRDESFRGSFCSTALKIAPEDTGELRFGFCCCCFGLGRPAGLEGSWFPHQILNPCPQQ